MSVAEEGASAAAIHERELIDALEVNDEHANGALEAEEKEAVKSNVLLVDVPAKHAEETSVEDINGGEHANGLNGHNALLSASTEETDELPKHVLLKKPVHNQSWNETPAEGDEASAGLEVANGDAYHTIDEALLPDEITAESIVPAQAEEVKEETAQEAHAESETQDATDEIPGDASRDVVESPAESASADAPAEEAVKSALIDAPEAAPATEEGVPTSLEEEATASAEEAPVAEEASPAAAVEESPAVEEAVSAPTEEQVPAGESASVEEAAPVEETSEPAPVLEEGVLVPEDPAGEGPSGEAIDEAVESAPTLEEEPVVPVLDESSAEPAIETDATAEPGGGAPAEEETATPAVEESVVVPLMDHSSAIQTALPDSAPAPEAVELGAVEEASPAPIEEAPEPAPITEGGATIPEDASAEESTGDAAAMDSVEAAPEPAPVTEEGVPVPEGIIAEPHANEPLAQELPEAASAAEEESQEPGPVEGAPEPVVVNEEGVPVPQELVDEDAVPEPAYDSEVGERGSEEVPEGSAALDEAVPSSESLVTEEVPEAASVTEEGVPVQPEEVLAEEVAPVSAEAAEESAVEERVKEELVAKKPVAEEVPLATEVLEVEEEPVTELPAAEEAYGDEPAVEESAKAEHVSGEAEEPVAEAPATEEAAAEESSPQEPLPEEPEVEGLVEEAVPEQPADDTEKVIAEEETIQEAALEEAGDAAVKDDEAAATLEEEPIVAVLDETSAETAIATEPAAPEAELEAIVDEEAHVPGVEDSVVVPLMDESSTIQTSSVNESETAPEQVEAVSDDAEARYSVDDVEPASALAGVPLAETEAIVEEPAPETEAIVEEPAPETEVATEDPATDGQRAPEEVIPVGREGAEGATVAADEPVVDVQTIAEETTSEIEVEPPVEIETAAESETAASEQPSELETAESAPADAPVIQVDAPENVDPANVLGEVPQPGPMTPGEPEEERPKSPWTPSYSVSTQGGAGTGVADNADELAELSRLPPPEVEAKDDEAIQPEPQVTLTEYQTEIAPAEEKLATDDQFTNEISVERDEVGSRVLSPVLDDVQEERPKSPWTPSYSVTTVGSGLQEPEIASQEHEIEQLESLPPAVTAEEMSTEIPQVVLSPDTEAVGAVEEITPASDVQINVTSDDAVDAAPNEDIAEPVADAGLIEETPVPEEVEQSPQAERTVQPETPLVEREALERPKSPWTPSYSVTRTPEHAAESLPADEPVSQPPTVVLPVADSSIPERPKSPWTPSYSVTRSPDLHAAAEHDEPVVQAESVDNLPVNQDSEVPERPKSPWTPSYSVTRQGSGLTPAEEGELSQLEQLPGRVLPETSQQDEPPSELSPIPTIVTEEVPSSDAVGGHPAEADGVPAATDASSASPEPAEGGDTFTTEALDDLQKSTGVGAEPAKAPEEPFPGAEDRTPGEGKTVDGTSSTFLEPGADSTSRDRRESATSSRFFPGGWFHSTQTSPQGGRASLDSAQGEFAASSSSPVTENDKETEEEREKKKGKWCIIM
ncbi:hypothetical protein OE88DRAFT_1665536 [Heliocybe sulcata]|uniref:Uncharacterized protein n=1 Tax=Heliocybe sulcata TaxID=5364 RepID=A0A5C3MTS8_9AGAM|nr:hypothetical protein OE88DRAFT_1665536 [Heliocybe sulcata]